jgi:hypothetical protein
LSGLKNGSKAQASRICAALLFSKFLNELKQFRIVFLRVLKACFTKSKKTGSGDSVALFVSFITEEIIFGGGLKHLGETSNKILQSA